MYRGSTQGGNAVVRALMVVVGLIALHGCGQSSPTPEQGEKEDVEKASVVLEHERHA
jgi:predicted small lipoprotein YifL